MNECSSCIQGEGTIAGLRCDLDKWVDTLPRPWNAAMEATIFAGWIYDRRLPAL
jgi:transposase